MRSKFSKLFGSISSTLISCSYRNCVALSMCGGLEFGGPTDKEFDEHIIDYSEVKYSLDYLQNFFCMNSFS